MKLIDKDTLVAEIKRLRDAALTRQFNLEHIGQVSCINEQVAFNLNKVLSFLDTIEVKEVDLEKELVEWHRQHFKKEGTFDRHSGFYLANNSQLDLARHFFELGLKAKQE